MDDTTNEIDTVNGDSQMDRQLFIILDDLPKVVVQNKSKFIVEIKGLKHVTDLTACLMIEFYTKADADAAKANGFVYMHNGQKLSGKYVTTEVIAIYLRDVFIAAGVTIGKGNS